jgi:hypothetical protein
MNLKCIMGSAIMLIVLVLIVGYAFLYLDVMSYTATDSETFNPARTSVGQVLVWKYK